jgi:hypothetical protein
MHVFVGLFCLYNRSLLPYYRSPLTLVPSAQEHGKAHNLAKPLDSALYKRVLTFQNFFFGQDHEQAVCPPALCIPKP